jgi:protein TonB
MEANKVLNASLLDIMFDGRNKEYGAYELRKHYNKRLIEAIIGVIVIILLVWVVVAFLSNQSKQVNNEAFLVKDVQLEEITAEKKIESPPPPPPPKQPDPPKVEMAKFTPPKIVKDDEIKAEEKPPEMEKLEYTKIGTMNQEGVKDEGIVPPVAASDGGKGIIEVPKAKPAEDYEKTFLKVEIESEYPGGAAAWKRYLNKNFHYPEEGLSNEIQGVVIVQFIVDKEGNVSDVQAVSGPEEGGLREEAIRVIRKSGTWIPAVQNGRKVKSYKKQPVIFKLMAAE